MASLEESRIIQECRIHPLSVPLCSPQTTPLTFFDLPWVGWFYYKPVYFYELHHPKTHFLENILPKIKHSLSLSLQHFYPLAGNLTWPQDSKKPVIVCSDSDSVALLVTESDLDFEHMCGGHQIDVNDIATLVPQFSRSMSTDDNLIPLLALQITLFPDKGICIAFNFHHAVVDGRAAVNFIRSWASICKLQGKADTSLIANEMLPCLDRTMVKDPKRLELKFVNGGIEQYLIKRENFNLSNMPIRPSPLVNIVLETFTLSCSDIKHLKQLVVDHSGTPLYVSTFVVALAYVWICSIKARWGENNVSDDIEHLLSPVDCRARLEPPLPASYFGNCLGSIAVMAKRKELLGEDGIGLAAKLIGNEVQNVNESVWNALEKGVFYIKNLPWDRVVIPGGSPKFGFYKIDFGWGNPKKVMGKSVESNRAIYFNECPNEEGAVEIGLISKKPEVDAFASIFSKTLKALS